ncbi:hypothetical protein RBU60_00170 [Mesonia sp. MT50]|uniref:Uncharacterized protein n=1 Tax=Mesonia profundi TaxID=3070998 RepID=A0ABU0ZWY1_9FLAO|nr:hypothetical protein [Mesonia profundi]MDQ7915978.1 hypothetical protein [Mesonia profundi]
MKTIDDFKYVVIPMQYKLSQEDNQYLLNTTTKFLLKQEGFITFMEVEKFPKDLIFNQCLALYADVENVNSSYFSFNTKLILKLKDCFGNVVFESREGKSKKKKIEEGYKEALINTFDSFKGLHYAYNGNTNENLQMNKQQNKGQLERKTAATNQSVVVTSLKKLIGKSFHFRNEVFILTKIEAGYLLMDEYGSKEAFINQTSNGSILYNSERLNGSLIILENGDLQVEYFNKETGKLDQAIFKKQA